MKNLTLPILIYAFWTIGCTHESQPSINNNCDEMVVEKENISLVMNLAGTHCIPCGEWGWDVFYDIMERTHNKALPLSIYGKNMYNDPQGALVSETGTEIEEYLTLKGWPTFVVNNETKYARDIVVNVEEEKRLVIESVDIHNDSTVIAGAAVEYIIGEQYLYFNYLMEIFRYTDLNDLRLAIYLVEDDVEAYQAGHQFPENAVHSMVLRKGFNGAWGIPFVRTSIKEWKMSGSGFIELEPAWNPENFRVYAIIYKVTEDIDPGQKHISFVNAAEGKMKIE